jgi:hypothetical protein
VRIARAAQYGQHIPVRFASRLTSLLRGWRIVALSATPYSRRPAGGYLDSAYLIARLRTIGPLTLARLQTVSPPELGGVAVPGHVLSFLELCGYNDGLQVNVDEIGAGAHPHLAMTPLQVVERMQLLGPKPSHWVTNPLP